MALNREPPTQSDELRESVYKICCNTQPTMDKTCFTWNIKDFSLYLDGTGEFVSSSKFSIGTNDKLKWMIDLYPKGFYQRCNDHVAVFFNLYSGYETDIRVKFKISILDAAKKEIKSSSAIRCYKSNTNYTNYTKYGWYDFFKRDLLLSVVQLCNDILTIVCEVSILSDSVSTGDLSKSVQFQIPESKLLQDFRNLFEKSEFTDVTIVVGGHELQAHKAILSARSVVFAAMFQHEMEENQLNRVVITDVDYEVFHKILHFIYTDEAENLENIAADLLAAADKYALEKLKIMCEETLRANLSIENAANTVILADRHNTTQLKAYTTQFINKNVTTAMETEAWINMIKIQGDLFTIK